MFKTLFYVWLVLYNHNDISNNNTDIDMYTDAGRRCCFGYERVY